VSVSPCVFNTHFDELFFNFVDASCDSFFRIGRETFVPDDLNLDKVQSNVADP
jgi:hypothetical protein